MLKNQGTEPPLDDTLLEKSMVSPTLLAPYENPEINQLYNHVIGQTEVRNYVLTQSVYYYQQYLSRQAFKRYVRVNPDTGLYDLMYALKHVPDLAELFVEYVEGFYRLPTPEDASKKGLLEYLDAYLHIACEQIADCIEAHYEQYG